MGCGASVKPYTMPMVSRLPIGLAVGDTIYLMSDCQATAATCRAGDFGVIVGSCRNEECDDDDTDLVVCRFPKYPGSIAVHKHKISKLKPAMPPGFSVGDVVFSTLYDRTDTGLVRQGDEGKAARSTTSSPFGRLHERGVRLRDSSLLVVCARICGWEC